MVRIRVVPFERILEGQEGENLFSVFQREAIPLESYCGGMGSCGKCVVRVLEGKVTPLTVLEREHLGKRGEEGFRLACQVVVLGDVSCDVSPSLQTASFVLLGDEGERVHEFGDSPIQRKVVLFRKPSLFSVTSLKEELAREIPIPSFSRPALQDLSLLGGRDEVVLEAIWDEREVFALFSPPEEEFLGIAFDLGTTTVACALVDLASQRVLAQEGVLNRQVRFGADVISRLRAIQDALENLKTLQRDVLETMNELVETLCRRGGWRRDRIFAVTVAGNTIMEHLFLGLSPLSVGVAPFVPVLREGYLLRAKDVGLLVHPEASVYVLPCVAGYVGGDVVGGIGALKVHETEKVTLYIDIGTNGEIVLISRGRILACGTAAGPAFEGAGIRFGMRASQGAISAVSFENGEVIMTTIGDLPPQGICGTGLIDIMAGLLKEHLLSPTGRFQERPPWSRRFEKEGKDKRFVLSRDPYIYLTQRDVEKLQLALAAMRAGRSILLREAGLEEKDIEEVVLAGAFGSFIRPESAKRIGLIPEDTPTRFVGNAALLGAQGALLSRNFRKTLEHLARRVEYIELSARRDFEEAFCEGLVLPGATQ